MDDTIKNTESAIEDLPSGPAPIVQNRFLFVDVSAQRAKQLRRGALPRLPMGQTPEAPRRPEYPHKLERIAMEEVRLGIIPYELPGGKPLLREDL